MPLRLGSPHDFSAIRDLLLEHKFLEQPIVERLQAGAGEHRDGLDALVSLFARAEVIDAAVSATLLGKQDNLVESRSHSFSLMDIKHSKQTCSC